MWIKTAVQELTDLQDTYCSDCLIKKHFRKEYGKNTPLLLYSAMHSRRENKRIRTDAA